MYIYQDPFPDGGMVDLRVGVAAAVNQVDMHSLVEVPRHYRLACGA
jgi:hypothetical protein